ncbi:hypothetical protein ACOMHN_063595 [Nucella lapillus]
MAPKRLGRQFYDVCGEDLARALLGQKIVRMVNGTRLSARIVETEAYLGGVDKAAHSYKGQTDRNKAMFMEPGTSYVYSIYGMYVCFNISSRGAGCAALIRSVEPVEGVEMVGKLRQAQKKKSSSSSTTPSFKPHQLANGPAKLCQALDITKQQHNQQDLVTGTEMWLEEGEAVKPDRVVVSARINIAYAEDWTDKPLRFYVLHNPCVSVRNKAAEKLLEASRAPEAATGKQGTAVKGVAVEDNKAGKRKAQASKVGEGTGKKKAKSSSVSKKSAVNKTAVCCTSKVEDATTSQYFSKK